MESVSELFSRHLLDAFGEQVDPLRPWALIPKKQISKKTLNQIAEIAKVRIVSEGGETFYAFNYNALLADVFTPAQEQALIAGKKV